MVFARAAPLFALVTLVVALGSENTFSINVPSTIPSLLSCASHPAVFSCENTTPIQNTCCSPTPGGLVLAAQYWSTYTGREREGQLLPKDRWTIHGLWPDNCDGQYDPIPSPASFPNGTVIPAWKGPGVDTYIREFGREDLLDYMNKYWINQGASNPAMWAHEFSKHGTCTSTFDVKCYGSSYKKNQELINYYDAAIRADKLYPSYDILAASGIAPSNKTSYTLAKISTAIKTQIGVTPYIGCTHNGTVLSELWYFHHVLGTEQYVGKFNRGQGQWFAATMLVTLKLADTQTNGPTRRALSDVSLSVVRSKRIVVVTGAGISCSCGIPDFRSSDGLYNLVKQQYPDVVLKGRDLFDASLFRDGTSTSVFYTFISKLKQSIDAATPSPTHNFIKTLDTKKKLVRSYTQNIDGLEERVGLMGSSSSAAKIDVKGKAKIRARDVRNVQLHVKARVARSARAIRVGALRPAIVLYDEPHPLGDDIGAIQTADLSRKPDLLIIMGTSLKVHGLRKMVKEFAKTVHASGSPGTSGKPGKVIFVNKTPPASEWNDIIDYHIEGDTDSWVDKLIEDWKKSRPADWEVQQTLVAADGDVSMSGGFKVVKEISTPKSKGKGKGNTPDAIAARKNKVVAPPLSPSKRGQSASHYSDLECSPSKRRVSTLRGQLKPDERKVLFTESTNNGVNRDDMDDLSMLDVELEVAKPNARAAKVKPVTKPRKTSTQVVAVRKAKVGVCTRSSRSRRTVG
ncbi:hypothetical protein C0991_009143 [Blastosporella zonata]|nr:hypothetical protein C0991_009143 [Blastosporella zonata]